MSKRITSRNIYSSLALGLSLVSVVIAIGYASMLSLGYSSFPHSDFSLSHWGQVLNSKHFWNSFLYTARLSALSIVLTLVVSIPFVGMDFLAKSKNVGVYRLGLSFAPIVAAFMTFWLLSKTGFFSSIAYRLKMTNAAASFPSLVNDNFGLGIILTHAFLLTPFFILFQMNIIESRKLYTLHEVSKNLGISNTLFFLEVYFPIIFKALASISLLYFIILLGSYEVPLILGSQSPKYLSLLILEKLRGVNLETIPQAYAISLLMLIIMVLGISIIYYLNANLKLKKI